MSNSKSATVVNIALSAFLVTLSVSIGTLTANVHKTIKNVNATIEQVQSETLPKVNDLLQKINGSGPNGQPGLIDSINQAVQEINTVAKQLNGTELAGERAVLYQTVAQVNALLAQLNNRVPAAEGEQAVDSDVTQILNSIKQLLGNAAEITAKVNDRITDDSSLQKAIFWNGRNGGVAANSQRDDEDDIDLMQGSYAPPSSGFLRKLFG